MDSILLAKKVELFNQYLSELKELVGLGVNEILADTRNYHTAERLFQLLVDTAIDINTHLLKAQTGALPDALQSTCAIESFTATRPLNAELLWNFWKKISPILKNTPRSFRPSLRKTPRELVALWANHFTG